MGRLKDFYHDEIVQESLDYEPSEKKETLNNFRKFHRNNPRVFHLVLKYAYMHKDRGRTHYSIEIILNVIRHHVDLDTVGDQFKINNNYKPFYSRMAMIYMGDDKFFEIRGSIADDWDFRQEIDYYNRWKEKENLALSNRHVTFKYRRNNDSKKN